MKHLFLILLIGACLACAFMVEETSISQPLNRYQATSLSVDTTQLWIGDGDISSDTVLVIGEGGPKHFLDFESAGRVYWEYLPHHTHYYFAVVHQANTYNRTLFDAEDFTLEDAKKEVDNTSEMLYRTIQYFKDRGKYVVVLGHSYSAFVIPHYLSTRPSLADKYILTCGRLNADSVQTAYQLKGINLGFEEDGKTLILPEENKSPNPYRRHRYKVIRKNIQLLKYAIGKPRYTQELKEVDLSNVVMFTGLQDQNVGTLIDKEIQFLEAKGATVVKVEAHHYDMFKRVVDAFREGHMRL